MKIMDGIYKTIKTGILIVIKMNPMEINSQTANRRIITKIVFNRK